MDYVLFGMGYGASLMLLGWALRTFGPQLKYKQPPKEENAEYLVEQRFWVRFIQGLGGVIAIGGTAMVLLTFVVVLINPTDTSGRNVSIGIWAVIMISVLVWCWFYISKYGLAGIWSRQNGYGFRNFVPTTSLNTSDSRVVTTGRVSPRKRIDRTDPVSPDAPIEDASSPYPDISVLDAGMVEPEINDELVAERIEPETEPDSAPVYDFGDGTETTVPSDSSGRSEALRRLRERQARARQSADN